MSAEDVLFILTLIACGALLVVTIWAWETIGNLKDANQRLNNELKKLTDRDERGRFTRREDRK